MACSCDVLLSTNVSACKAVVSKCTAVNGASFARPCARWGKDSGGSVRFQELEAQTLRGSMENNPGSAHSQHIAPFFHHVGNVSATPAWHVDGFLEVRLLDELHEICASADGEHYLQLELVNARLLADALTIFDRLSARKAHAATVL